MRWAGRPGSRNVEDRRGMPTRGLAVGGGLGTLLIVILVLLFGGDPGALLQQGPAPPGGVNGPADAGRDGQLEQFVSVVLKDTEDVWHSLFRERLGQPYAEPTLALFSGQTRSGCGFASAATGPFYCPADQTIYLDLSFFRELQTRFGAPGDFAMAYVIAHEVGHHVQDQLGITDRVHRQRGRLSEREYNRLSVRLELQADFLAGVWAHHAERMKQILEAGDVDEAIRAASAVGDDHIQRQARGSVMPDSFTHGTSAQRARWFRRGLQSGDLSLMDELFERDYQSL